MPVTILRDDYAAWLDKVRPELQKLGGMTIRVGVLGQENGELLMIANVHEFGATIRPSRARNLAIPCSPRARKAKPADFDDAFVWQDDSNPAVRWLVRPLPENKLEFLYMLVSQVTIPERSFIRASYDAKKDVLYRAVERAVGSVITGEITAQQAADQIGNAAVGSVKRYMGTLAPPKSAITLAADPRHNKPLMSSGRLRNSITYEVIWA